MLEKAVEQRAKTSANLSRGAVKLQNRKQRQGFCQRKRKGKIPVVQKLLNMGGKTTEYEEEGGNHEGN